MDLKQPRWLFRPFWTRPAFIVGYAAAALALVPFLLWLTVEAVAAGHALDQGSSALTRVEGTLDGPHGVRRSVNDSWDVGDLGPIEVGPGASATLKGLRGQTVTALLYRGEVVAIETPDGQRITGLDVGLRGAVEWGAVSLFVGGLSAGGLRHARRKRRACGGWWVVSRTSVDVTDRPVLIPVAFAGALVVLLRLGLTWQVAGGIALAVTLVVVVTTDVGWRWIASAPGRHARED
ncbi:hypothetical protein ASC77_08110 [Nocardioides sp. Root1257]|uniref:hypothetical protein n=1 Tax=unclassified Nocardioides TaxID=2615069 RepID=UPI0006F4B22A|nr:MULTISPECIES: hypothetical protein [unclassified Nocardioides]KQW48691.1 hypothetical protein ASC77_08110 [Nocardioides sp. Root1257]KRC47866.1 hypothetical protein ASE24_08115 [Nocardioides sp. Root224]